MLDFLDNKMIQGTGHLAQAYAKVVLDRDFKGAYDEAVSAFALFRLSDVTPAIRSFVADVETRSQTFSGVKDAPKQS